MAEQEFMQLLMAILDDAAGDEVAEWDTFANMGVLTANKGLVVTMDDGSEFQLTIVQSR
jgi:hypothetical protein